MKTRLREDIYVWEIFWLFCVVQALGEIDKGRGSRHKGEKGKWMSGSSEKMEEKGSKPQEKGLIWDSRRNAYTGDQREDNWKYT